MVQYGLDAREIKYRSGDIEGLYQGDIVNGDPMYIFETV